jgi:hypothetical protein
MADGDDDLREIARARLRKRRDFVSHLVCYLLVNALLIGIWAFSGAGYFWPVWVLLGWGVGLAFNAWDVFFRRPITEQDIERETKRMRPEGS